MPRALKPSMVYYNPRTGLFAQFRGGRVWGLQTAFYRDASGVRVNAPAPPPWWLLDELIAMPEPMLCNILAQAANGEWIARAHLDGYARLYNHAATWTEYCVSSPAPPFLPSLLGDTALPARVVVISKSLAEIVFERDPQDPSRYVEVGPGEPGREPWVLADFEVRHFRNTGWAHARAHGHAGSTGVDVDRAVIALTRADAASAAYAAGRRFGDYRRAGEQLKPLASDEALNPHRETHEQQARVDWLAGYLAAFEQA